MDRPRASVSPYVRPSVCESLSAVTQGENGCLREQISAMNKELEITKEKLYTLEQAWESADAVGTELGRFLPQMPHLYLFSVQVLQTTFPAPTAPLNHRLFWQSVLNRCCCLGLIFHKGKKNHIALDVVTFAIGGKRTAAI